MSFLEWFPHTVHTVHTVCKCHQAAEAAPTTPRQESTHHWSPVWNPQVWSGVSKCGTQKENVRNMWNSYFNYFIIRSTGQVPAVLEFPLWDKSRSQPRLRHPKASQGIPRHPKASQGTRQTPGPLNDVALVEGLTQSPAGRVFLYVPGVRSAQVYLEDVWAC